MQFFDLKKQHQNLKLEIDAAISRVLESGVFIGGPEVEDFEKEAADFFGVKHAIGLNSGTDALVLSLRVLGIGAGNEVIVPALTYFATAEAVAAVGATPVFCDIDSATLNIDTKEIERKINSKTKAIIPVHFYGRAADMAAIVKIAKRYDLFVVEDAAQAAGAQCGGKFCGTIGDVGCFSLFPTKNLGAFGDGGFVLTDRVDLAQKIRLLRAHGAKPEDKYNHLVLGMNSRLDAIQAATVRVKLRHLDEFNQKRIANAARYNKNLEGAGDIVLPGIGGDLSCIFHQYTIRTGRRDELAKFLKENRIPTMVYYPVALHLQPGFAYLGYKIGDFPKAELAVREILSLPIYPELLLSDQDEIVRAVRGFWNK